MLIQAAVPLTGWTLPGERYYAVRPTWQERLAIRYEVSALATPLSVISLIVVLAASVNSYSEPANGRQATIIGCIALIALWYLCRRYGRYRSALLRSNRVVLLGIDNYSNDYRWNYLLGICNANEITALLEEPRGNTLLDEFLIETPVEAGQYPGHPDLDDTLFQNAATTIMGIRDEIAAQ